MVALTMLEEIVLLTGEVEGPSLSAMLHQYNPNLHVACAGTPDELRALSVNPPSAGLRRLIAFCTPVVVPADILATFNGQAYNFHPGPPSYPGTHPASFAVWDGAPRFGVTLHEMAAKVDSGPIVAVAWFDTRPDMRFTELEMQAYKALVSMFSSLAERLACDAAPLPPNGDTWTGRTSTRKAFERMREVSDEMDEDEIKRRFRAFG